jgi:hypothetical protein
MKNPIFVIIGIIVVVVVVALYLFNNSEDVVVANPLQAEQAEELPSPATFNWRFAEASTNNPDGNPQTNVYLTINYDGRSIERHVDTVDGDCNILEGQRYEDDISNAGSVQCYAAGLGQQYRVTQGQYIFFVERKLFEEALPDVTPPVYEW